MTYQRILCATDFSEASERAVLRAVAMARECNAELAVVHVIEHFPEDLPAAFAGREDEDPQQYLITSARQRLSMMLEKLGAADARQHVVVSRRSARHEIIEAAQRLNADLLVVGTAPRHVLPHLGSTASGLLHAAACDLLVVKTA